MNFSRIILFISLVCLSLSCTVITPFEYSTSKIGGIAKPLSSDSAFRLKVVDGRSFVAYIGQVYSSNGLSSNKVVPQYADITPTLHGSFKKILRNQGLRFDSLPGHSAYTLTISVEELLGQVGTHNSVGNALLKAEITSNRTGKMVYSAFHRGKIGKGSDLLWNGKRRAFGCAYFALDDAIRLLMIDPAFAKAVSGKE